MIRGIWNRVSFLRKVVPSWRKLTVSMATTFLLETQNFYFERPFSQETWKGGKQMVIGVVVGHIYYNLREKNFGSRQRVMSWWRHHVKVQASKWRHHAITFCGVFIWAVKTKHTSYHHTRSCSLSFASKIFKIRLELTEICAFFCGDDVTDLYVMLALKKSKSWPYGQFQPWIMIAQKRF